MPNALITSSLTVAVGLVVYGATQFAQRFWLDPVTDLMKALGRAAYACVYYANVYSSPESFARSWPKNPRRSCESVRANSWPPYEQFVAIRYPGCYCGFCRRKLKYKKQPGSSSDCRTRQKWRI